jgi:hypothetical protein
MRRLRACVFLNLLKCNRLNLFQRVGLLKRRAEKLNHFFMLKASFAGSIVWTIAKFFVWTKE